MAQLPENVLSEITQHIFNIFASLNGFPTTTKLCQEY